MTCSQALSGSLTVFPGLIWVAPTAVTKGQDAGNVGLKTGGELISYGFSRRGWLRHTLTTGGLGFVGVQAQATITGH